MYAVIAFILLSINVSLATTARARECLSNRLSPGLSPNAQQAAELLRSQRASLSEVMSGSGFSRQAQARLLRLQGQVAVDREYRRFLMQSRPAPYVKHTGATSIQEAIDISSGRAGNQRTRGQAQFTPGLVRERVEARALREMPGVYMPHGGSVFKFVKFDNVVGYDGGRPTHWMRVEVTASGEFHGHPMQFGRVSGSCAQCRQFGE